MSEPVNTRSFRINPRHNHAELISSLMEDYDEYSFDGIKKLLKSTSFDDFENELAKCQVLLLRFNLQRKRNALIAYSAQENTKLDLNEIPSWMRKYAASMDLSADLDLNQVPSWMRAYIRSVEHENSYTKEAMRVHRLKTVISTLAESSPQTRKNLWQFQAEHPQEFNNIWSDFLAENFSSQEWNLNSVLAYDIEQIQKSKPCGTAEIKGSHPYTLTADHSYEYTVDKNLKHIIHNLNDTGLDLCIVNKKIAILNNSTLTFEQSEALEKYFVNSGKWPENMAELNKIMTKDSTGCDIPLGDKIKQNHSDTDETPHNEQVSKLSEVKEALHSKESSSSERRDTSAPDTTETSEAYNPYKEFDELSDMNSYDFIKATQLKENTVENRNHAIDELCKEFRKKHGPLDDGSSSHACSDITHDFKSITITFWPTPDARAKNNVIDSKKHTQGASTQLWSMKIYKTNPPKIGLYIPNSKNFSPDDAGAVLKYFQDMGCTTFTMPSADTYGSDVYKAFLEASVKQRIPLKLKPDGMEIKDSDIANMDKIIQEKMNCRPEQKIDFLLRWSRQLDGFSRWGKGNASASTKALSYLQQARFLNFNSMCAGALEGYMKEQTDSNKWTDVDVIMAKIAMTQLVTEISKGQMGGKPWNPAFGCKDEEKAILKANVLERFKELHNKVNRQAIVDEIIAQKDDPGKDTKANQVSRVEKRYNEAWINLVSNKDSDLSLASLGVAINSKMFPTATKKDPGYNRETSSRTPTRSYRSR